MGAGLGFDPSAARRRAWQRHHVDHVKVANVIDFESFVLRD